MAALDAEQERRDKFPMSTKRSANKQSLLVLPTKKRKTKEEQIIEVEAAELAVKEAMAMLVAEASLPLDTFNHPAYRHLVEKIAKCAKINGKSWYNKDIVRTTIYSLANEARALLKKRLEGKAVIATTDHWTSRGRESYAALTMQFIDDECTLKHCVLAVYHYKGSTQSELIAHDFIQKLNEWGLYGVVPYVVTDTEAKMNKAGQILHDQHKIQHIYCMDHLLQLVAVLAYDAHVLAATDDDDDVDHVTAATNNGSRTLGDGPHELENDEDNNNAPVATPKIVSSEILKKVRRIVGFFNKSTQARADLRIIQKEQEKTKARQVDVIQDVVTRWWSTLAMLDRMFHLRESLAIYASRHPFPRPSSKSERSLEMLTHDEWKALDLLRTVLKPFKVAQQVLKGNKYVTSSLVPFIVYIVRIELNSLLESTKMNASVNALVAKMMSKFNEIFGSTLQVNAVVHRGARNRQVGLNRGILFAHVLDPRFKNGPPGVSPDKRQELWTLLKQEAVTVVVTEEEKRRSQRMAENISTTTTVDTPEFNHAMDSDNLWWKHASVFKTCRDNSKEDDDGEDDWYDACHDKCSAEIRRYRNSKSSLEGDLSSDLNVLEWWRQNKEEYPILWKLARVFLAIPATAAPAERAFSVAGNIVTARRNRLSSELVEDSHLLHGNAWLIREQRDTIFCPNEANLKEQQFFDGCDDMAMAKNKDISSNIEDDK